MNLTEDIWFEICKYISLGDLSVYVQYVCKEAYSAARKHIKRQRNQNKPPKINMRKIIESRKFMDKIWYDINNIPSFKCEIYYNADDHNEKIYTHSIGGLDRVDLLELIDHRVRLSWQN